MADSENVESGIVWSYCRVLLLGTLSIFGGWFSWHVILCTFGYIPLMAESIMLFVGDDIWSQHMSRKAKYAVHGILVTIGTGFTIVGNALVFHYIESGYHLYTAHGITGLISMITHHLSGPWTSRELSRSY
ncbi:hypothetical protein JTB14_012377 [Gonioctena quinquepunctata]|nr:hypothetical protein JTB14_012377 [Gonioctena quinquepunctata]